VFKKLLNTEQNDLPVGFVPNGVEDVDECVIQKYIVSLISEKWFNKDGYIIQDEVGTTSFEWVPK
jgi:hypothetical protein